MALWREWWEYQGSRQEVQSFSRCFQGRVHEACVTTTGECEATASLSKPSLDAFRPLPKLEFIKYQASGSPSSRDAEAAGGLYAAESASSPGMPATWTLGPVPETPDFRMEEEDAFDVTAREMGVTREEVLQLNVEHMELAEEQAKGGRNER